MALLLKERGFYGDVDWYYPIDGGEITQLLYEEKAYEIEKFVQAPALAMAMKWVRENGWYIEIRRAINCFLYYYYVYDSGNLTQAYSFGYETYEKAVEEALKVTLEFI